MFFYFFCQCIKMLHVGDKVNVILLFLSVYNDVTCRG